MECSAIAAATAAITSLRHRFGHKFMVLLPFPFEIPFAVFVGIISTGDRRIASTHTHTHFWLCHYTVCALFLTLRKLIVASPSGEKKVK